MIMWREGEREWRERGSKQKARVRDKREGRGQAATFIVDQAYLAVVVGVVTGDVGTTSIQAKGVSTVGEQPGSQSPP